MKTNWIIFFLIVIVSYGWMLTRQAERERQFKERVALYEIEKAKWDDAQAEREEMYRQAREAAARAQAGLPPLDHSTTPTTTRETPLQQDETSRPVSSATPSVSADITDFERMLGMETARTHVVDTPLYAVRLTEWGARPVSWEIKDSMFVRSKNGDTSATVQLIPQVGDRAMREFPLELAGRTVSRFNNNMFTATREDLDTGTRLVFRSAPIDGMVVTKDYFFRRDSYVVDLMVTLNNQLGQTHKPLGDAETGFGIGWQGGFGVPAPADRLRGWVQGVFASQGAVRNRTVSREAPTLRLATGNFEWAGLENKYFTAIVIPDVINPATAIEVYFNSFRNDANEYRMPGINLPMSVALYHPPSRLDAGDTLTLRYQAFVGPKNRQALTDDAIVTASLESPPSALVFHTVPLGMGWLRPLCLTLLNLMRWLFDVIGQWGLAIVATTLIVRTIIYPLTHWAIKNQARTMIEQQKIRPEMEAITKKYKNEPAKRNQAVMQLYRDHNVNPLGFLRGCLPMLLQMPVFLALYVVFEQSVELRGQSFLWIDDLSAPDALYTWGWNIPILGPSLNILPLLMAVTNYLLMKIMQTPTTDELQARIQKQMMIMMPVFLVLFLYQLPSGLILYWTISNTVSIGQSYFTKRIIAKHMAEHEQQKLAANGATLESKPART